MRLDKLISDLVSGRRTRQNLIGTRWTNGYARSGGCHRQFCAADKKSGYVSFFLSLVLVIWRCKGKYDLNIFQIFMQNNYSDGIAEGVTQVCLQGFPEGRLPILRLLETGW